MRKTRGGWGAWHRLIMWPLQGSPEMEGEKHKLGGNWSDRNAHLAHGRTMCRGRYEKEVTPYHWRSPGTSPRENCGFLKSAFQCILSDQGKKFKILWWLLLSHILHQPNKSIGNQSKVNYDGFIVPLSQKKIIHSIFC